MKRYVWIVIVGLIYLVLSITNPVGTQSFGFSELQIRLILLTISLPFLLSWVFGINGTQELRLYSNAVRGVNEKKDFKQIARGILILVLASIVTAFLGILKTRLSLSNPEVIPMLTIVTNYLYILPTLISFWLILGATRSLAQIVNAPPLSIIQILAGLIITAVVGVANIYLTFTSTNRQAISGSGTQVSYFLPDILIALTIILPSILTWFLGTLNLIYAQKYFSYAKGTIYRSAISNFFWGIALILVSSAILQLLLAIGSDRLLGLGVVSILLIIYGFVIIQTYGFILIAIGSRKFSLIEKVLSKYEGRAS